MKASRKLCGLALALVLMLSAGMSEYVKAADWHYNGGLERRGKCNNTYRTYDCGNMVVAVTAYTHKLSDGRTCYVYAETHCHTITCSSCGYAFAKNETMCCTVWHSIAHTAPMSGCANLGGNK